MPSDQEKDKLKKGGGEASAVAQDTRSGGQSTTAGLTTSSVVTNLAPEDYPLVKFDSQNNMLTRPQWKKYAEIANYLMAKNGLSPAETYFLRDYVHVLNREEYEKEKASQGLVEISRDLTNLPPLSSENKTVKLNELVIKPEIFDGERPKPRRWIQDFNETILANGWSDEIAIKYLPTFLTKSAKDWYFTDIKPKVTPNSKWHEVYKAFARNYMGEADYEQLRKAVENSRQRPGESVSNYIPRIRRLLLLLTPSMPEADQIREIRLKLRSEYKQLLAFSEPKTISALREYCLKIEAGFPDRKEDPRGEGSRVNKPRLPTHSRSPIRHSTYERPNGYGTAMPAATNPPFRSYAREGNRGQRANLNMKDVECYRCNKKGHMSKDCWSNKGEQPRPNNRYPPRDRQVNMIQESERDIPTEILTIRQTPK